MSTPATQEDWISRDLKRLGNAGRLARQLTEAEWSATWTAANAWAEKTGVDTSTATVEDFVRAHAPGALRDLGAGPSVPAARSRKAEKIKKGEFLGAGAAVQAAGLVACFFAFPFGIIGGIALLIIGGRMAIVYKCSECAKKVDREAKVCAHCGSEFTG